MKINWIELRNKENGFMLKHSDFDHLTLVEGDNQSDLDFFASVIRELREIALGINDYRFLNYICRVNMTTQDAKSFLWYCKTRAGEEQCFTNHGQLVMAPSVVIDEEEIYTEDDRLLFSRNSRGVQLFNESNDFIALNPHTSMPKAYAGEGTTDVFNGFCHMHTLVFNDQNKEALLESLKNYPVTDCLFLDGRHLSQPCALDAYINVDEAHPQIIAIGFTHADKPSQPLLTKRNGISLQ